MDTESLLRRLSEDPERATFARDQRALADASEARDTMALADFVSSMKKPEPLKGPLDKAGIFFRKAVSQSDAGYVDDSPKEDEQCDGCSMFREPGSCTLVDGDISPDGWCRHWEKR